MPGPPPTMRDASPEAFHYAQWRLYGRHLEEYASELAGTAFLVFCLVGVVALMFAPSSPMPRWIPFAPLRLLCAGLLIGSSGWLVAISPPGRLSGAHINPAVSLGFWLLGKMHKHDFAGYVLAQLAGGVLGAVAGRAAFGRWAREIQDALLAPAAGVSVWGAFAAEVAATFALASVLFFCVSHKNVSRFTPVLMTLTAGVLVCLDGHISGAGMNPARWFGPAFVQDQWRLGWVYWVAPCVGAVLAALPRRYGFYRQAIPATAKLFHDPRFRSIFQHDHLPSALPAYVERVLAAPPSE